MIFNPCREGRRASKAGQLLHGWLALWVLLGTCCLVPPPNLCTSKSRWHLFFCQALCLCECVYLTLSALLAPHPPLHKQRCQQQHPTTDAQRSRQPTPLLLLPCHPHTHTLLHNHTPTIKTKTTNSRFPLPCPLQTHTHSSEKHGRPPRPHHHQPPSRFH